ncbi:HNH/endonuclease VII fold putative polymorphic toxin [Methylomicrobium album]|uniref:HNH/endonuclease VII fold putative polymorphic toxin n=1 Tax=Methylomicrobium TaxID=39773 RepID=UPI0012F64345
MWRSCFGILLGPEALPPFKALEMSGTKSTCPTYTTIRIRDDSGGHNFGAGNIQNRGPHFNDEIGNHYDY